jgi:small subunit ribosomal protein S13
MARIAGITLPKGKRIEIGLTYVYGIGRPLSRQVLEACKIDFDTKTDELTPEQEQKIRDAVLKFQVEGDLKRQIVSNVKRLQDIGTYRGFRHRRRLPCRGQRTKTNARTKRGKRVTMGSGRLKESKT